MTKKTCLLVFLTLMLGMFSAAWAATINVPGNHATIQAAIDAASDGDEIQIAAGTYNEHVIINKAISLLGPNANISAVDGTRVPEAVIGQYITVNNGAGLSDVIIAGFEFNETDAWHSIIMIGGNTEDVQILNNRFINIPWKAIYTEAGANVTNLDMIISGNLISGVSSNSESGIYLINHTGGTISNNKIENTVYGGILINTYCHGMTISNNQIYNVPQQGLQLSGDVADVTVSGNIIDHANTAEVSDKGGIRLYASDFTGPVLITGNTISNSYNGIAVKDGYGSLSPAQQEWIQIRNNDLSGNVCGVYMPANGSDYLDAEENWWGDPAGPTLRNGVGVTAHVLFDPWYADAAMTTMDSNSYIAGHSYTFTVNSPNSEDGAKAYIWGFYTPTVGNWVNTTYGSALIQNGQAVITYTVPTDYKSDFYWEVVVAQSPTNQTRSTLWNPEGPWDQFDIYMLRGQ
ncbi:MAG TPA: right-handed parallel beta-helix repeat-containing protein, partial [Candidatus Cloacimonadota bacterium]|nr:right-handed parallel beta-helix repeat-containing protein [Candidatus Cloacimonadota bacterium]